MKRIWLIVGLIVAVTFLHSNYLSVQAADDLFIEGLENYQNKEFPIKTDLSQVDFTKGLTVYDLDGNSFHASQLVVDYSKVNINKHGTYPIDYYFLDLNNRKQVVETITIKMIDSKAPVIRGSDVFLNVNQQNVNYLNYITVSDDSGLVTKNDVLVTSHVDLTQSGVYYVNYFVSDPGGNYAESKVRVIVSIDEVVDTEAPVFSQIKPEIKITLGLEEEKAFDLYQAGVKAMDGQTDLTSRIIIDERHVDRYNVGEYPLIYVVSDDYGNTRIEKSVVTVVNEDTDKPVISGPQEIEVTINTIPNFKNYVTAMDEIGGDITSLIEFQNNVDPKQFGEYYITYKVKDYSGNVAEKTIKVVVKDNVKPTIVVPKPLQIAVNSDLNLKEHIKVSDNYDQQVDYTFDASKVNLMKSGTYVVNVQAIDDAGNVANETFFVNVYDNTGPDKLYEDPIVLSSFVAIIVSFIVLLISSIFSKARRRRRYR